jgi:hypothetical protein
MRLLHPRTLEIASSRPDIPKTVISHVWSEIFKWKASGQKHPKCFIDNDYHLGQYMSYIMELSIVKDCNLDGTKITSLGEEVSNGYRGVYDDEYPDSFHDYFNNNYLFSDACSLYYKGINIFPDIFGDEWRKYVPVESHKEIHRQLTKTLNK